MSELIFRIIVVVIAAECVYLSAEVFKIQRDIKMLKKSIVNLSLISPLEKLLVKKNLSKDEAIEELKKMMPEGVFVSIQGEGGKENEEN